MGFVAQMLRGGKWVRMGSECDSYAEAERERVHHLSVGTARSGRDIYGLPHPNNPTRVVEIAVLSDAEFREENERDERVLSRGR